MQPLITEHRSFWRNHLRLALLGLLFLGVAGRMRAATCTPTSVRVCVEADDEADLYVDGLLIAHFNYVNWDSSGVVPCQTITNAAVLAALADGGTLSTRVHNIGSGEMWAAYSLDVNCSSGQHSYISSATTGGALGYHQTDCNTPPAAPPGSGSTNWYDTAFNPSGWSAPVVVTGQTWGKPVYNPQTGAVLPQLSYSNTGSASSSCEYYYMHQPFTINPTSPPGPPLMTISKSANPTTNITSATRVTYTLHVCNTGGFTDNPVTITDNYNSGFRYDGPNGGDTPNGPNFSNSGSTLTIKWPNGFAGGNTCQDVKFWVTDDYQDPNTESCLVRANQASLGYNNNSSNQNVNSNTVNVTMLCIPTPTPTNTWTRTPTWTYTRTNTWSPTRSNTPTWTNTWTHTFTRTYTNTNTYTFTPSRTPTRTFTSTNTHTPTNTFTRTNTNTPTRTNTNTHTFTPSFTPTRSYTPTNTNTNTATRTPTWTYSPTKTNTPTWTPTWTHSNTNTYTPPPTPTWTPVITNTFTRSATRTATPTATRTSTQTSTLTATLTRTPTRTASPTVTITFLDTFTHSPTRTDTRTVTRTQTTSATPTSTPTRTASPTVTITFLDTYTSSPTRTDTRTVTRTQTPSATLTATPTRTPTSTVTITFLDTYTNSPTVTPTRTVTKTQTPSATRTATSTVTITFLDTHTDSPTVTDTRTVTKTQTPSATRTATSTVTITFLDTYTDSPTVTATRTATPTPTSSATHTATPTFLDTFTDSPTSTATSTVSDTPSSTPTVTASATLTSTRTASPSVTATPSATPVSSPTNTPTATPSFTDSPTPTASPTVTLSVTDSPTTSKTATASQTRTTSPTRTASPSLTATPSATPSFTATQTITPTVSVTATPSATPTHSPTPTASPTARPIPMPYQLQVALYSSSGERVRLVYEGPASSAPEGYSVSGGISTPLIITLPGTLPDGSNTLRWDQDNDSGQSVGSGSYILKLQGVDPFGAVLAYSKVIQVQRLPGLAQLVLYNSAGEAVRHYDPAALGLDPVDLGRADAGRVQVKDRNGSLNWLSLDGLNDSGQALLGGNYSLVLHWSDSSGSHTVTREVAVVPALGAELLKDLSLEQNPVPEGQPLAIRYQPCSCQVTVRVHNLAGQLISQASDFGSGRLELALDRSASGIYLVTVEAEANGQRPLRRVLKAAIIR